MKIKISEELLNIAKDNLEDLKCSFEITETSTNEVIIKPVGCINSYNATFFQERMEKVINTGCKHLVFDMSNTKYVSAVGIGSFIHIFEILKMNGGDIVLNNMQKHVVEVFQLPGFAEYFDIDPNANRAVLGADRRKMAVS